MAVDSALIVVAPGDSMETIIQKVRGAGAGNVELLVADGTSALQSQNGFARLRQSIARDRIELLVISSDEKTLDAARLNQLDALGVHGTRVTLPAGPDNDDTYRTRSLSVDELDRATKPSTDQDTDFLNALDEVSAQNRYADLSDEDAEMFAALDDLSDTLQRSDATRRGGGQDDSLAAALDEWDAATDEGRAARPRTNAEDWDSAFAATDAAPRRRTSAQDIDLSDDDRRRQQGARRAEVRRDRIRERATPVLEGARRLRGGREDLRLDLEEAEDLAAVRRRRLLTVALPLAVLLLLLALLGFWYLSNRATVAVAMPSANSAGQTFPNEVIPITSAQTDQNAAAVQAAPVDADAEFTTQGQVLSETLSPASSAKGVVTLINTILQTIQLPAGTELVGTNAQGQEVRFTLDVPATVPAAVTSTSLAGVSTQYGTIDVGVTARSPGSASNVGENSIKQILIPGQQPLVSDTSNFLIRHAPIGGGSDQPQRVVTNADFERVLGDALTGLYNAGVQSLRSKINESQQAIDLVSIYPDPQALGKSENYETPIVSPPIGQLVDASTGAFSVTVKAHFRALATPLGRSLGTQLQQVGPQHFSQLTPPPCKPGEQQYTTVTNPRWNGTSLMVDATISCASGQGVPASTLALVRDAVRGRSRADAEAQLQQLQQQGLIGGYTLPDRDRFPGFDPMLNIQVEPSTSAPEPTVPTAQPTTGTP
jgi:hypothetical protein